MKTDTLSKGPRSTHNQSTHEQVLEVRERLQKLREVEMREAKSGTARRAFYARLLAALSRKRRRSPLSDDGEEVEVMTRGVIAAWSLLFVVLLVAIVVSVHFARIR